MFKNIICFFIVTVIALACSSKDNPDAANSTDRVEMLTNLGNNVIIPSFLRLDASSKNLVQAAAAYAADAKNEQKLRALQASWLSTATSWKAASLYTQGPIENDFLVSGIYFTPTNYAGIEKEISQTAMPVSNAYIEGLGASLKGIPAIEYMIYNSLGNTAVIKSYDGPAGARRAAYLTSLCENLQKQAAAVGSKWEANSGNYVKAFIAADGRDINSSFGILTNKMVDLIYTIKDERLGAPLGKRNNGTPQPGLTEARFSNASLSLLRAELQSIEDAFTGTDLNGNDGAGFDEILDHAGAKSGDQLLSLKIKNQFATVYSKLDQITTPLSTAVTGQTALVNAAYDEVKKLQVMMEVDMINNLGVLLTFSDNDGD